MYISPNFNDYLVALPDFAQARPSPWIYVGWIKNPPITSGPDRVTSKDISFNALVKKAARSDHGEIREVDIYPEGAVCWYREL